MPGTVRSTEGGTVNTRKEYESVCNEVGPLVLKAGCGGRQAVFDSLSPFAATVGRERFLKISSVLTLFMPHCSVTMRTDPLLNVETKPPKLRWFQYRLRSLFIFIALVAVACSFWAVTMKNQRQQKLAADAITKAGGIVVSEPTWLGRLLRNSLVTVTAVKLIAQPATEVDLAHLQAMRELQSLILMGSKITDGSLVHLQGLSQLQCLGLDNTKITDAGLAHIQGLSQLQCLDLDDTKITDAGLVHIQGLSQLQRLDLGGTSLKGSLVSRAT
jgi:hypothetical protein